jgi:hypothetical protein
MPKQLGRVAFAHTPPASVTALGRSMVVTNRKRGYAHRSKTPNRQTSHHNKNRAMYNI